MKTRERIVRGTAERAREPLKKTGSHAPYFLSQEQGRERAGGGGELYFFGCLERAQRSSSTRTRCNKTLRDEVSDRGRQGRERRKEREVKEDAARPPERKPEKKSAWWGGKEGVRLG